VERTQRPTTDSPASDASANHPLRRVLRLHDLIPMQILIVLGVPWTGTAARQGGTHVSFWLVGALLLFLPVAAVVQYCVRIWPFEGGVYQ
jgi:amino acid transporter